MAATTMSPQVQRVLGSPRGRRFGRPGENLVTGEQRMLAQTRGNPRAEHRPRHDEFPERAAVAAHRNQSPPESGPFLPLVPRPRPAPDDGPSPGPAPGQEPPSRTRPSRPPLPRRPRRPASHRKPRRRVGWALTGYTLAVAAGALAHHLVGLLG